MVRHSFLDHALRPAAWAMARMRFRGKAILVGTALMVTCLVLAGVVMHRDKGDLDAMRLQLATADGLQHLHRTLVVAQEHEHAAISETTGSTTSPQGVPAVMAGLDAFSQWQGEALPDSSVQDEVQALRSAWARFEGPAGAVPTQAEYAAARDGILELMVRLQRDSGLILAADPAVYYMGLSAADTVPVLAQAVNQQGVVAMRSLASGTLGTDDRDALAGGRRLLQFIRAEIEGDLHAAESTRPELARTFGEPLRKALASVDALESLLQRQLVDEERHIAPPDGLVAQVARRAGR